MLARESNPPMRYSNPPAHTYLGHLVPVLSLRAQVPRHSGDAEHDTEHDGGVCAPVLGLGVPTTGGGPDVLGVPSRREMVSHWVNFAARPGELHVRDLGSATHECLCGLHCCDVVCMCCSSSRRKAANHHAVLVEVRLDGGRSGQAAGVTSAEREKSKSCASSFAESPRRICCGALVNCGKGETADWTKS